MNQMAPDVSMIGPRRRLLGQNLSNEVADGL